MLPTSEDIVKKLEGLIKEWMKGDIPESEYLPFDLLFLELAAFQVAPHHPLIEFLTEFAKEISAAVIFATLHIHIYVVAVLYLHSEDFWEGVCQFLHTNFSITDTIVGVESIQEFDQICCPACPAELLGWFDGQSRKESLHSHLQQFQLRVNDKESFQYIFPFQLLFLIFQPDLPNGIECNGEYDTMNQGLLRFPLTL